MLSNAPHNTAVKGRVLIIAGSDSGGGAGIQGDIKTVTCLGGYASTAITALTAQNTNGVFGIHEVPLDFLKQQMELVLTDIGADVVKTGMLHSASVIETVAVTLKEYASIPLVLDPVMVAKGGSSLLQAQAVDTLKTLLLPRTALLTPNIPEAELLTGRSITSTEAMREAAKHLLDMGANAVLIKGGHMESGTVVYSFLLTNDGVEELFTQRRIITQHTHGTGCTLASAIATGIASGTDIKRATARSLDYVARAIEAAPKFGGGHGPLKHNFMIAEKWN